MTSFESKQSNLTKNKSPGDKFCAQPYNRFVFAGFSLDRLGMGDKVLMGGLIDLMGELHFDRLYHKLKVLLLLLILL